MSCPTMTRFVSLPQLFLVALAPTLLPTALQLPRMLPAAYAEEVLVDVVLASVDGIPITLSELSNRLGRRISVQEVGTDAEARALLDALINQHVLLSEAQQRRIEVIDEEVDAYIKGVADRNNLSVPDFLQALKAQGTSIDLYKEQVKVEIIKSRITSQELRESVAVSEEEVSRYIEENPHEFARGMKVKLRTIFLSNQKHTSAEVRSLVEKIQEEFDDSENFAALAEKYSEGPEASDGGIVGEILEKELSPSIFNAVFSLDEEEMSDPVKGDQGIHLFYIEERVDDEEDISHETKERVRKMLEQRQLEMKLATFFSDELLRTHAVDRKI
jgi:peptidyl-prolyl cis-trans isomerase SurA